MNELEFISIQIITLSGSAKSKCFEAIKLARKSEFDKAQEALKEAENLFIEAHKYHAQLLQQDANKQNEPNLLLIHAEDQLMGSEVSKDLVQEFIEIYKELYDLKSEMKKS